MTESIIHAALTNPGLIVCTITALALSLLIHLEIL